jgi:alpha-methylacyl-CoA racemase
VLQGIRVVELAAVGPVPFAAMLLADLGADVIRIDRMPGTDPYGGPAGHDGPLGRGRRSVALDLRTPDGVALARRLVATADVVLEGYRPGVLERLGLDPAALRAEHPALVVGRMTGFGQDGPDAPMAGHDLTYLAVAGVLHGLGMPGERPVPPMNLVADFGGGAAMLVTGVLAALVARARTGEGRVVDVAMADGAAYLATMPRAMLAAGLWRDERGVNLLDGGAPNYRCYRTADDRYVAVAAVEPQFWAACCALLGLDPAELPSPYDPTHWPVLAERLAAVLQTRTRDEWASAAAGTDACLAPVLTMAEAPTYAHHQQRGTFTTVAGTVVAAAPLRFDGAAPPVAADPVPAGADTADVLAELGVDASELNALRAAGTVA